MRQLFKLNAAPTAALGALTFVAMAAPAPAHAAAYCGRSATSYMLSCGFDTMAQCQATSSGRGWRLSRRSVPGWGQRCLCLCAWLLTFAGKAG